MGNLLAGMLEADPDFKKVVSRYMNRAGFDTKSSTAHPASLPTGVNTSDIPPPSAKYLSSFL